MCMYIYIHTHTRVLVPPSLSLSIYIYEREREKGGRLRTYMFIRIQIFRNSEATSNGAQTVTSIKFHIADPKILSATVQNSAVRVTLRSGFVHPVHVRTYACVYRVSQEECEILRETVPYVKLYRWAIRRLMLFIFFLPLWVFGTRHRDLLSAQGFSDPIGWPSRTGGWEGGVVFYSKGSIMCKQGEILRPSTCTDSPSDRREEGTLRF